MRQLTSVITLLTFILLFNTDAAAQLLMRKHAKKHEHPPKALLVQLPTYENRMEYFRKSNNKSSISLLKKDADSMVSKIVADFNDNFNYCPVYYFYDRDLEKVKSKNFIGILLNDKLQPINNTVINQSDTNYFIVNFGHVVETNNADNAEGTASAGQTVSSSKQKLQVYNHLYHKIRKPLPNGVNNAWGGKTKRNPEFYRYESAKFDIYYNPYVAQFNGKLHVFYGKYPY